MKKIIIPIIMLLAMAFSVIGADPANNSVWLDPQNILQNNSYQASSDIYYNFIPVGNITSWDTCFLYTNENGTGTIPLTLRPVQTMSNVANNTQTNFTMRNGVRDAVNNTYIWNVFCNDTDNVIGLWGNGTDTSNVSYYYTVDTTNPVVTINSPDNRDWYIDNTKVRFNLTVVDTTPAQCTMWQNFNTTIGGDNTTDAFNMSDIISYTNNTAFEFEEFNASTPFLDNGTGIYQWNYTCNDSAGNTIQGASYRTFYIDTVVPAAFDFNTSLFRTDNLALSNASTATDYTPQIGWNPSSDLNFSHYMVKFFNSTSGNVTKTISCVNNITSCVKSTNMSLLGGDLSYYILITAYDVAGNEQNMTTKDHAYSTDSTNRELTAGWNIIGNLGNIWNLSNWLDWTGATTVSKYATNHTFRSYVDGGLNGELTVLGGEPFLIYLSSTINLTDMIWNESMITPIVNITNQSNSDYNLVVNRNRTKNFTLGTLDQYFNCINGSTDGTGKGAAHVSCTSNNVTVVDYQSFYDNTATSSPYTPLRANWTINNATSIHYGQALWLHLGGAEGEGYNKTEIDWNNITEG